MNRSRLLRFLPLLLLAPHIASASPVYVVEESSEPRWHAVAAAVASAQVPGPLLIRSPAVEWDVDALLRDRELTRIVQIGAGRPHDLWRQLGCDTERVIVCPATPRGRLLRATHFAVLSRTPLFVLGDGSLAECIANADPSEVIAVGHATGEALSHLGRPVRVIADETELIVESEAVLDALGGSRGVIVANPADVGAANHSRFAPYLAATRRCHLVWTDPGGTDVRDRLAGSDHDRVTLLGDYEAIPLQERPDPLPTGRTIRVEQLAPHAGELARFAFGRLCNPRPEMVLLQLARPKPSRSAVVVGNPGGGLDLLEACSRRSAAELAATGVRVRGFFGKGVTADAAHPHLAEAGLVLWEGHHKTFQREWPIAGWPDRLPGSLVVLQSCRSLREDRAIPLIDRGAAAVIGSTERVYSASGGAFALSLVNAMVHDGHDVGGAVRNAQNFLICFTELKQKRLGDRATMDGANLRAAWTFGLWGEPGLDLLGSRELDHAPEEITFRIADEPVPTVSGEPYRTEGPPNLRFAGLTRNTDNGKTLVPMAFRELRFPGTGTPRLETDLDDKDWVFLWDRNRRVGYLLAVVEDGTNVLRFRVRWETDS